MAKCSSCGKEIAENTAFQVGDNSFCNEQCRQRFDKNEKSEHFSKNAAIISLIIVALITVTLIWLFANRTNHQSDTQYEIQSDTVMARFTSPDNSFSVLLPGKVQEKKQSMSSEIGPVEIFTYSAKSKYHDYTIIYVDYPHFMVEEQGAEELLEGASYGTVMDNRGKLMTETAIDLQGYPGRELKIAGPNKEYIRVRLYLVDNRLYQIKAVSKVLHTEKENVETVFASFNLNR